MAQKRNNKQPALIWHKSIRSGETFKVKLSFQSQQDGAPSRLPPHHVGIVLEGAAGVAIGYNFRILTSISSVIV